MRKKPKDNKKAVIADVLILLSAVSMMLLSLHNFETSFRTMDSGHNVIVTNEIIKQYGVNLTFVETDGNFHKISGTDAYIIGAKQMFGIIPLFIFSSTLFGIALCRLVSKCYRSS